ncbi:unnamed protein product, partial [Prorocentrum cordatum]
RCPWPKVPPESPGRLPRLQRAPLTRLSGALEPPSGAKSLGHRWRHARTAGDPRAVTLLRLDPEDRLSFRRAPDSREHSRTLRLTNRSGGHVAYKVKTTAPEAYAVQKHLGKIGPGESCDVTIVLQDRCASDPAQVRSHRFLVQAAPVGSPGAITKEAWALLDKGSIQEHCLPVVLDTAGVSAPATASAAASWARTESETELKVKYDELVQYRELLEKETQSIEAELVGLRNPRRTGVAGSGSGWSCCRRQT